MTPNIAIQWKQKLKQWTQGTAFLIEDSREKTVMNVKMLNLVTTEGAT